MRRRGRTPLSRAERRAAPDPACKPAGRTTYATDEGQT